MKFPLAERPFAPVRLTSDQRDEMESIVHGMVLATVREYEHFAYINGGRLSKNSWKAIKHRENLTVLRERINKNEIAAAAVSPFDWSLPKLLMTGTVVGTLDDIMYGTLAPTSEAMRIRSTYVQDEILDAQILSDIQVPTVDEPFRFLGIKWAVRSHSSTLNPMAWPRDTIVVEGTGIHVTPAGGRLGYRVIHSVDLPGCRELKAHGIMRTRTSSTAIYKQLPNGIVDVYMTRFVESTGSLSESTALTGAAASMLNVWKSVWCSQNKKLSCAARVGAPNRADDRASTAERLVVTTDDDGNYCCGLCHKHYTMFHSVITCQACNLLVCSKCQVRRKLARVNKLGEVTQHPVLFCKSCISRSLKDSAFEVARSECVASPVEEQEVSPVAATRSPATSVDEIARNPAPTSLDLALDLDLDLGIHRAHASSTSKRTGHGYHHMSVGTNSTFAGSLDGLAILENDKAYFDDEASLDGLDIQTVDDWDRGNDASCYEGVTPRLSPSDMSALSRSQRAASEYDPSSSVDHQQKLWMQMSQLCLAAEETYLLAKKNADAMRHQKPAYS